MSTEEEVGVLSGSTPVDAVYTEEDDGRTYDLADRLVLIIDDSPDKQGERFATDAIIDFEAVVPIYREQKEESLRDCLGTANLSRRGDEIYADLTLIYSTPERLTLETGGKLYPSISGWLIDSEGEPGNRILKRITIESIVLSVAKNSDPRIPPINTP